MTLLSSSVSQGLGHAVCEHLSRGDAWGLVASPGSGLELCEERWNYGLATFLLLLGGIALFVRTKTAIFIYDYYRRIATEGKISLESPSVVSLLSSRSSNDGRRLSLSYDDHHRQQHSQQHSQQHPPSTSTRPRTNTNSSRHSRASSSSTVRPFRSATASRIMLLPPDYQSSLSSSPSLQVTPPSPHLAHSNSSCDSIDTVKGVSSCSSSNPSSTSRKRAMSHDSASHPYNHVVVYAPVLMSIEEAQQLGGKEAVIASSALTSGMCSSPTNYSQASASPRLRNVSPPDTNRSLRNQDYPQNVKHRLASTSPPRRSDSEGSNGTIVPDSKTPVPMSNALHANPFGSIKGFRDTTEMEDLASAAKKA